VGGARPDRRYWLHENAGMTDDEESGITAVVTAVNDALDRRRVACQIRARSKRRFASVEDLDTPHHK
jgi:hypothetical protein